MSETKSSNRIKIYEKEALGLERNNSVHLEKHNPRWKRIFSDEAHLIYDELRIEKIRLYHCGSTSIPGIAAKPIIDIVGAVPSIAELDTKSNTFDNIGYEYKGEYGIPGRRYCVLYNPEKTHGYFHLHFFEDKHPEIERHLLFRDYLRNNEEARILYEKVKLSLHEQKKPRDQYTELKKETISKILDKANSSQIKKKSALVILGSAHGGGKTLAFMKEKYSNLDLQLIDLVAQTIHPYDYNNEHLRNDAFYNIIERMIKADLIIFATPVYWYAMSGALKNFFDRFSNLLRGENKKLGEALYGKKMALLSTGYDERLPYGFEVPFSSTAIYMGMDYLGAEYKSTANEL